MHSDRSFSVASFMIRFFFVGLTLVSEAYRADLSGVGTISDKRRGILDKNWPEKRVLGEELDDFGLFWEGAGRFWPVLGGSWTVLACFGRELDGFGPKSDFRRRFFGRFRPFSSFEAGFLAVFVFWVCVFDRFWLPTWILRPFLAVFGGENAEISAEYRNGSCRGSVGSWVFGPSVGSMLLGKGILWPRGRGLDGVTLGPIRVTVRLVTLGQRRVGLERPIVADVSWGRAQG